MSESALRAERLADELAPLFSLAPFSALDARGRADVRAASKLLRLEPPSVVYSRGEAADTVCVVLRGSVRLERDASPQSAGTGRVVKVGEMFGEEAWVPFSARNARAISVEPSTLVELSTRVLERALVRAGAPEHLARLTARARRAAFRELVLATPLGRLPAGEIDALAALFVEERCARGQSLSRSAPGGAVWLVAGGLFEVNVDSNAAPRIFAARGDFIGVTDALAGRPAASAAAAGDALALRVPPAAFERLARRHPSLVSLLERTAAARRDEQRRTFDASGRGDTHGTSRPKHATRRALAEMDRFGSARSLLAIDLERCTRCGHCAWVCADSHGSARLERRGDKVRVTLRRADSVSEHALLFPNACQHCREPACLEACPTAAIRRDATGAVFIEQDLCTGCGACATACPWDAVRMAARGAPAGNGAASAEVAVKCDLCRGADGPECVSACPTDAIFRIDPARAVVEARAALSARGAPAPAPAPRAKTLVPALVPLAFVPPLLALARSLPGGAGTGLRLAAGVLGGALLVLLLAHAAVKRLRPIRGRLARLLGRARSTSVVAPLVELHAASGVFSAGCVLAHAGLSIPNGVAGLLVSSFWMVTASGALGALAYRFVPARLARLERRSLLPEDAPREREELVDRLHAALSGANPAQKELVRRVLAPYASASLGPLALLASGRTLSGEAAELERRVERLLGGHRSRRLAGIEELVRTAVEMRALRARRLLSFSLRAWLPLHLAGSALVAVLLVLHVLGALR